jgi:hypothetical protein
VIREWLPGLRDHYSCTIRFGQLFQQIIKILTMSAIHLNVYCTRLIPQDLDRHGQPRLAALLNVHQLIYNVSQRRVIQKTVC